MFSFSMDSLDFDPRTRYTVWTGLFGGYFLEMVLFGATQPQIQRYNSVPTFRDAKWYFMCRADISCEIVMHCVLII